MSTILVTGATGFVGRHLVPSLENQGWLVRRAMRQAAVEPTDFHVGPIGPLTDWKLALQGVDTVIHLAAQAHNRYDSRDSGSYTSVNTDGTLRLARCCAEAGVRHFVFLSTILVSGNTTDGRAPFQETDPPNPRSIYAKSKAAAEQGLFSLAAGSPMKVTIIRPPLVYGQAAMGNFRTLLMAVKHGRLLPFGSIKNRRAFISVENLASFIEYQISNPQDGFEVFQVADEQQVSTPEFISEIARALGTSARLKSVPPLLLKLLFRAARRPEAYDSVVRSMVISIDKALGTGWRPPLSLAEGLSRAVSKL
jgi:UDP-glucose 4-epimerase